MAKVSDFVRRMAEAERKGETVQASSTWGQKKNDTGSSKVSQVVRQRAAEERKK